MVVITMSVHPRSLNFQNQRKAASLRAEGWKYSDICGEVVNLEGAHPPVSTVADLCKAFSTKAGKKKYAYEKCGRKKWKLDKDAAAFVINRLKVLRKNGPCTCATLQHELARGLGLEVDPSTIAKFLKKRGFKWLPRSQKRKYDAKDKASRRAFARKVLRLSVAQLKSTVSMCMDGVILHMPPTDRTDRLNFCRSGTDKMWRKKSEACSPDLAGDDPYHKQIPISRALPMWAGISSGGFATVTFHAKKKCTVDEWVKVLTSGRLTKALKEISPDKPAGPFTVLCDGERFLHSRTNAEHYKKDSIALWKIPRLSPDLNPVEKFWSWLRRRLLLLDLKDALANKSPIGKMAYQQRVRAVCASQRAQQIAKNITGSLRATCKEVVKKKGAATRG
jgi:transposase